MSQIPRSQFALKKRPTPMVSVPFDVEHQNGTKTKKNGSNGNGNKHGNFESNDVVIIEDAMFAVVGHEEVVASIDEFLLVEEPSPTKKKRSRKSKDSTESKDSDAVKKAETTKSPEKSKKVVQKEDVVQKQATEEVVEPITSEPKEFKVLMLSEGLSGRGRRSDRLQNASTIVNLSTVSSSESTKLIGDDTLESNSIVERRVSGRRSTRPIDDIKFSYRTPNPDDSMNATTNATIGSDFTNDSLLATPGSKRPLDDSLENIDSPKRSRLDLSGLFRSFSSPVAILRNKFKRTNIASTPIVGGSAAPMNESVESLDSSDLLQEVDLESAEEVITDDKEELKVITTPLKKTGCVVM